MEILLTRSCSHHHRPRGASTRRNYPNRSSETQRPKFTAHSTTVSVRCRLTYEPSMRQETRTYWHIVITSNICAITVLTLLCFLVRARLRNLRCYFTQHRLNFGQRHRNPGPTVPCPRRETSEQGDTQPNKKL